MAGDAGRRRFRAVGAATPQGRRMTDGRDDVVVRLLTEGDLEDLIRLENFVWGWTGDENRLRYYRETLELNYTVGAFRDGRLMAAHCGARHQLTVPGGRVLDVGGGTGLIVHPLFRGHGLMTAMTLKSMEHGIRDGL